jgi:tetratricopeptide (TPR) repeat protein
MPALTDTEIEALLSKAVSANAADRLDDADRYSQQILSKDPMHPEANLVLGIVALKRNDAKTALPLLSRAATSAPNSSDAAFWFSTALRVSGRISEAVDCAHRAAHLEPTSEHVQNHLGMCLLDAGDGPGAVTAFQAAIELAPNTAPFFDNLGRALQASGRNTEAIATYEQSMKIGPIRPGALYRLGDAYMAEPNADAAAGCARAILRMNPNSAPGNLLLARALIGAGKVDEGAKYAQIAMGLAPGNAVPVAYYGRALQSLGDIEQADEQFKRSIELEPHQGFAYYALVHNHRVKREERPIVDKMLELLQSQNLPPRERIQLEYGLGKSLEDLGEFDQAMRHFDAANQLDTVLKVGVPQFQKHELEETANFLIRTFEERFLQAHLPSGDPSDLPIFVVGMMRSGTTLAEQILSSHPQVGGAGEQLFWPDRAGAGHKLFDSTLSKLDRRRLNALSREYLNLLGSISPGTAKVVDKMNTNYLLLGLLHVAFPNARIVHMIRHPVDTCLSIWATPVAQGINLCASKNNVVFAYEQYLRVMEHWRTVLPKDRLLDVQYENLVSDQETVTRHMIDFCGLEWSNACLQPERNRRSVKTPSVWQVRQPVYKTSMERWRKYEPWLGDFARLLSQPPGMLETN